MEEKEKMEIRRHSMAHVLAKAVKTLYPSVKIAIGPAIDNGFYYDFDIDTTFAPEDFGKIEKQMQKILNANESFVREEVSKVDALELFADEPYKIELINELPQGEVISIYRTGNYVDLCRGPHVENTSVLQNMGYKIERASGAYWRGNEKNKMLQRIYVLCFGSKKELSEYIAKMEDALKRDHNKIGRELGYFTTVDYIGQGLPILLPNGAKVIQILQRFVEDEEEKRGWQITKTPFMAKSDLYKISGHWDHYKENMFIFGNEETDKEVFALRPMTCPFQYQAYLNKARSYRDLPLRYNETSTLFRNEASGEMHGLIRVRQFTISEGHLMCTPEQLVDEFKKCLELVIFMLKAVGLYEDVSYRFSQWDPNDREKYIGTPEQWNEAQSTMESILKQLNIPYEIGVGEAAFYGPKLDVQLKNVFGKEDTAITIQIDQMLAEKFGMEYVDKDGVKRNPYIIHRTSLGCYERTLAFLLEKYAGALPVWLMPTQIMVMNVSETSEEYATKVYETLRNSGFRVQIDSRNEKIGYKIREAAKQKIPYIFILGEKEANEGKVSIRKRNNVEINNLNIQDVIDEISSEIKNKK